jgi:acetyltransferase-like isoleucine patch superfamily enzyme
MKSQEELKDALINAIKALWDSEAFALGDTPRQEALRPDILRRMLALVMTDDERARLFGLPEGCRVRESAKIISPEKLRCGKHVWIGEGAVLDASGGLEIGDHTSIGLGVMVWTHSSHLSNLAMSNQPGSALIQRKPTRIGSGCFIGGPAVVYAGVEIGDKCLIQPMSVVTTNIPPYSVVAGSPAKVIKVLSEAVIERMISKCT